ncbi:MAG TPA: HNH endonuclease [bacterium]|nr:HNH endonuclease [bacterium]
MFKQIQKQKCLDCNGKIFGYYAVRCLVCRGKAQRKDKPECLDCDKVLSVCYSKRCVKCHHKNSTVWNKGTSKIKNRSCITCQTVFMPKYHNDKQIYCSNQCVYKREPWNKGKTQYQNLGEKNPNWQGGKTKETKRIRATVEYKNWRINVFTRDDFTCQSCGNRGGNLNADHELPFALFPDLRFEVLNGRTLCGGCHRKTDTYGNAYRTRDLHLMNKFYV